MFERPFRGSVAVARGLVTPGALRGARFVRLFPDIYVAAGVSVTFRVLSMAAFLLVEARGGVLAGYSAAELVGSSCAPRGAPAEVLVEGHIKSHPRLAVRRGRADALDTGTAFGCRVTSPLYTAWCLARRLALVEAVVAVDALAFRRFPPSALLDRRAQEPGARGCRSLDRVVDLADARAESPMESRLRLLLVLAGLPRPEVQFSVPEARVRFDLAYPQVKLAIEFDSDDHEDDLDRNRDVRTGQIGWYTARFTKHDVARKQETSASVRALQSERVRLFGLTERDLSAPRK
jgi:very-short-patch-repair endonuclease